MFDTIFISADLNINIRVGQQVGSKGGMQQRQTARKAGNKGDRGAANIDGLYDTVTRSRSSIALLDDFLN
jgi:hypothetical protein